MDIVIDFVLVVTTSAFNVGFTKALIFGAVFLITIIFAPMIVIFLVGLPIHGIKALYNKNESASDKLTKDFREAKIISQLSAFLVYVAVLAITFYFEKDYFWAALVGIAFKLFMDFMWGDLPFQKPKKIIQETVDK